MGLFSRFTKKKEQNGTSQDKELTSPESSPRRRPSFEGQPVFSKQKSMAPSDISNGMHSQKEGGEVTSGASRSSSGKVTPLEGPVAVVPRSPARVIPLTNETTTGKPVLVQTPSGLGSEPLEGEGSYEPERGSHFPELTYGNHMGGGDSESDSSGEEGGSEREEEERGEDNDSEVEEGDEDRFGNEGGRFCEVVTDFYGTKTEEAAVDQVGYRSEGGQTPEHGGEEALHYHSEGLQGPEVSEKGQEGGGAEVLSPEEGQSGEIWPGGGELPKSDNEALTLAATWEKEKSKKKPWWKVFGPGSQKLSVENLTPRSGTESEPGRDISPLSDSAALHRKESIFRTRTTGGIGSERSRSPLWFLHREGGTKRGGDSGSLTSPPGRGGVDLSSPTGSFVNQEASPALVIQPDEMATHVLPPVATKNEEGFTALLHREHLRAVPERRELSWVKEWVSKVDPAEAPSDVEPELMLPEEPSSPPSWEGNLLLGPDPPALVLGQPAGKADPPAKVAVNADLVYANAVASEIDIRATSARLGGRGLKLVPPSLSIFGALKTLDLSRNSIAHIPSGVLPRGLHYLDLSFNKLTAVEGLRELTRLRVLNLHANRIVRIGHGLATCQSLRELHLSGNKIGEVEGLHRLLKLQVLDLSDNKITSTKSLGQLAANYQSLQALNLIGNPVLVSLGSEQLRRFITGLTPQVMYLNKQTLKTLSGRDAAFERAVLGSKGHSSGRGVTKREKGHGKSSPVRRVRASTGSVTASSSKRNSIGRSKSSSRLAAPTSSHHHHHHKTSSQRHHHHSGVHTEHHNAHSISRDYQASEVRRTSASPMKPPRPPSANAAQAEIIVPSDAVSPAGGFEFSISRVYSEGALETPRQLVKQHSGGL